MVGQQQTMNTSTEQSSVITRLIEEGIRGNLDRLAVKPVILSPKECSLSFAPAEEKLPLGVDLLDTVLLTIPKNQIEFVAWQIPIVISTELPTGRVLASAAHSAALFCCQAQAHGLVPMIDLRLTVKEYDPLESARVNGRFNAPPPRPEGPSGYFATDGLHFVPGEFKLPCAPPRWRATSPSCFKIVPSSPNLAALMLDENEILRSAGLALEMAAVAKRIFAAMEEMSVDFANLVLGIGVDIVADSELVRTGTVESLLLTNLARDPILANLGALCLILPPCQAINQKTLVEHARLVSPYPVLFAQLKDSFYHSAKIPRIASHHHVPEKRVEVCSETDTLLAAGC